jgi:hypothetical protein
MWHALTPQAITRCRIGKWLRMIDRARRAGVKPVGGEWRASPSGGMSQEELPCWHEKWRPGVPAATHN